MSPTDTPGGHTDSSLTSSVCSILTYRSSSLFVGSPTTIDTQVEHPTTSPVVPSLSLFASRPSLLRSSGAHQSPFQHALGRTSGTITRPTSAPGRVEIPQLRPSPREWSLFEQLMENEGQLALSSSRTPRHTRSTEEPLWKSSIAPSPISLPQGLARRTDLMDDTSDAVPENSAISLTRTATADHSRCQLIRLPPIPLLWKNILKCSVAYFLASLFTFHPYLSHFFDDMTSYGTGECGPSPSGHMIATIAVYYNPAKTIGGMIEADTFCFIGWLYSAFVCLSGMSLFWWLDVQPGWDGVADCIPILWVGLSMWGLSWMKVWMEKPTFNSACNMAATVLFIVIVKEGGLATFMQVSSIVLVGTLISNLVCFSLWPQSATDNLQANMTKTLNSFSTLLEMITSMFLLEEPIHKPSHEKMQKVVESHQATFTGLKKAFTEARSERFMILDDSKSTLSKQAYEDAVDSLTRLAQHLNALRSGTRLQDDLTKAQSAGRLVLRRRHDEGSSLIEGRRASGLEGDDAEEALLQAAADMFGDLMDHIGPPLKELSSTCALCLVRLREAFVHSQSTQGELMQPQDFHLIIDGIDRALETFERTSDHALLQLYRDSNFAPQDDMTLANHDHQHLFVIYFFIFTLQEFAGELMCLTDAMRRICAVEMNRLSQRGWWRRYVINGPKSILSYLQSFKQRSTSEKRSRAGLRRISSYFGAGYHPKVSFPKVQPHAPNTVQTPGRSNLSRTGRILRSLWDLGDRLKDRNIKYAFKVGMSTAMLAAPAFFNATRPIFTEYRGEWALVSFFVVMSPTIGATNFLSLHRVLGTLIGAGAAAGIYCLFPEKPVVLSIFGFVFSIPCSYYIVAKPKYATSGRFVLLTYNLTCLYSYNLRRDDVSVFEIAHHRSAAVIVGVLWAVFVSRLWWPSEARRELSKGLGEFCLNMGWLYTRLVASNSGLDVLNDPVSTDHVNDSHFSHECTPLLSKSASAMLNNSIQEFMAMELHLQIKLIELQGLLAQTEHEPRLKGPFPVLLYRSVLTSLQTILDKLHGMRCVTTREEWFTDVRRDFILPVNRERREMAGNIILYFTVLASAFRLKAPLPPYLPPAEEARERLVNAIRQLDVVKNRDVKASKQLLFFAYALTMKGVTQELDHLGRTLRDAFGVIGQTAEEFDALFLDVDVERNSNGTVS